MKRKHGGKNRLLFISIFLWLCGLLVFSSTTLLAQGVTSRELCEFWQQSQSVGRNSFSGLINWDLLQKASPDECYFGLGNGNNHYDGEGIDPEACMLEEDPVNPENFGFPKVNQGYAWSMTQTGSTIWVGTAANPHCLVIGGMTLPLGGTFPHETSSWVCEYEQGKFFWKNPSDRGLAPPENLCL